MKKRVIISVTNSVVYDRRMIKTAQTLVKEGYEVTAVGVNNESDALEDEYPFEIVRLNLKNNKGKLFYLEYNYKLFKYLYSRDFDILCAVDLDSIMPNVIVGKLKRKEVICDLHELYTETPELVNRKLEQSIWEMIERIFLPKCDKIYTVSDSISTFYQKKYNRECKLIYNYPLKQNLPTNSKKENAIIYVGDLNVGRGAELLIEAVKGIDIEVWILGDGVMREELEQKITKYQLDKKVKLFGKVKPEKLMDYIAKAKYGLNVLDNKSLSYYYSLSNKYFDYINAECIPISMNFPDYRALNEKYNCGVLIEKYDAKELKEMIISLQNDEKMVELLRKNCNFASANFNWEKQEKLLCSIYND